MEFLKCRDVRWKGEGKRNKPDVVAIDSISAALSCLSSGEERGLLSRTAAGNRA